MNTNTGREITPAEQDRLHRLNNKIEVARNFTQSTKAMDQMEAFQNRLMAKGVSSQAILKAMGK